MEQVIMGGFQTSEAPNGVTRYTSLVGSDEWIDPSSKCHQLVSTDGVIKYLRVRLHRAPGAGKHWDFTLMLNGAPSALTLEIADDAEIGWDMVHEVTVTGGDKIALKSDPDNTPLGADVTWTCVFEGDNANESIILGDSGEATLNPAAIEYCSVMVGNYLGFHTSEIRFRQVIPTAGSIKNLYVELSTDPGTAPDAYRFTLRKGGVSQALTVTITADDREGSDLINEVAVAAGDVVTMMIEPLETPSASPYMHWGMTFVADIDHESIVLGGSYSDLDAALMEYAQIVGRNNKPWTTTERDHHVLGQAFTLKKLYVLLENAPGVGNKFDFTIRASLANTPVTVTISGLDTTGNSGALEDSIQNDEYLDLKVVPDDTPDVGDSYWGFVCFTPPLMVKDVAGAVSGSGTPLASKAFTLSGSTGGSGAPLGNKKLILDGATDGLGALSTRVGYEVKTFVPALFDTGRWDTSRFDVVKPIHIPNLQAVVRVARHVGPKDPQTGKPKITWTREDVEVAVRGLRPKDLQILPVGAVPLDHVIGVTQDEFYPRDRVDVRGALYEAQNISETWRGESFAFRTILFKKVTR